MGSNVDDAEKNSVKQSEHDSQPEQDNRSVHTIVDNDPPPIAVEDPPPPPQENLHPLNLQYGGNLYPTIGTGWSAMAKIVREVDEEKIRDYKEDIDTILVFAGLFSAVMTALLVESYHNLIPDPSDMMILLMQQIAAQTHSYSFNAGFINSTVPPFSPSQQAFQPSVNAVRVNVLWFASLTLSLVSASFSILVKQWLREYLAGEYTSPQARLRIRHFRNPGLDHWKVFEIAAVLPLLLQTSLALFLIGLCFFTAEVHRTIGYTTLPLVAGWGTLFIAASFAPALSPRCPYKTTLLKAAMKGLRKQIFRLMLLAGVATNRTAEMLTQIPSKWSYDILAYDEEDAVVTDSNDIDILIAVDSIQSDEHLLSIMFDAVQQTHMDPAESVQFVMKILGQRIQRNITTDSSSTFLDLKRLPKQTTTSIMLMVAEILRNEISRQSPTNISKVIEWSSWMEDCVYILLSETNVPVPVPVNQLFSLLLADQLRYKALFHIIKSRVPDSSTFPHVLKTLRGGLMLTKGEDLQFTLTALMQQYFCTEPNPAHNKLVNVVRDHPEISPSHLQHLVDLLINAVTDEMKPDMYWFSYLVDGLELVLELSSKASWRDTVVKLVQTMLIQPRNTAIYCRYPMGLNEMNGDFKQDAQDLFIDAIVASNPDERRIILWNIESTLNWQWRMHLEVEDNSWDRGIRTDPLEASLVLLRLLKTLRDKEMPIDEYSGILSRVWWDVDAGLRTVAARHYEHHPEMAKRCLELINSLDYSAPPPGEDGQSFVDWANDFPLDRTWFPEYTIEALSRFLPPDVANISHRVRRARYLEKQEGGRVKGSESPQSQKSSGSRSRRRSRNSNASSTSRISGSQERVPSPISTHGDDDKAATSSDWASGESKSSQDDSNKDGRSEDGISVIVREAPDSEYAMDDNDIIPPSPTNTADMDHDDVASPPGSSHGPPN